MEENQIKPNRLPKSLTTVTTFSKLLAMCLFILLPFVGFYVGYSYHQALTNSASQTATVPNIQQPTPTQTQTTDIANWKTFLSPVYIIAGKASNADSPVFSESVQFSIKHPSDWVITESTASSVSGAIILSLVKGGNKISITNNSWQGSQLCNDEDNNYKDISSPFSKLRRVVSLFNKSSDVSEFNICSENAKIGYYIEPTPLGNIFFDLPKNYDQNNLDQMDSIISTLKRLK